MDFKSPHISETLRFISNFFQLEIEFYCEKRLCTLFFISIFFSFSNLHTRKIKQNKKYEVNTISLFKTMLLKNQTISIHYTKTLIYITIVLLNA